MQFKIISGRFNKKGFIIDKVYDPYGNQLAVCNYVELLELCNKAGLEVEGERQKQIVSINTNAKKVQEKE